MSHRLIVNPGTPQAWEIPLRPGVNRIGRTPENDFPINHPSLSTHHCEVHVTDQGVILKDLGSTNGTFVERIPVTEFQLHHGQKVQLGAVGMVFESRGLPELPDAVNLPADGARIVIANPGPGTPPAPPAPPGLRIQAHDAAAAPAETPPAAPPVGRAALRVPAPAPAAGLIDGLAPQAFYRGLIGALIGGGLGMFAWFLLIKFTGYEIGFAAWGVGLLVGGAARVCSKDGNDLLGLLCGACAFIAILGGQYLALDAAVSQELEKLARKGYREELAVAKSAVALKTREEKIHFLSVRDELRPDEITAAALKKFEETELPDYQEWVAGKPSEAEYVKSLKAMGSGFISKWELFKESFSLFTLLWLFLGVGSAWKLGSGNED